MWRHTWGSIAGRSHARDHRPCEDSVHVRAIQHRLIVAVADGAGSASLSKCGSSLVAKVLVEEAAHNITDGMSASAIERMVQRSFWRARRVLERAARQFQRSLDEFATTGILVVATPQLLVTGHLGDGGAVAVTRDGDFLTASAPSQGRYANETFFITDDDYADRIKLSVDRRSVLGIAAFSDGLQDEAFDRRGQPAASLFGPIFRWLEEDDELVAAAKLQSFLECPDLQSKTDDDITLAVALTVPPTHG
jgi:hypothetical protein